MDVQQTGSADELEGKVTMLARTMGAPVQDLVSWLEGLRIWIDRGHCLEEAIEQHQRMWTQVLERVHKIATREHLHQEKDAMQRWVADTVWGAARR